MQLPTLMFCLTGLNCAQIIKGSVDTCIVLSEMNHYLLVSYYCIVWTTNSVFHTKKCQEF